MYQTFVKRILDILLAAFLIPVMFPICFAIAVWIKIDSQGPIFFRQKRVGANNSTFVILKFRTMRIDAPHDMPTHLLKDADQWLTTAGRFLRRTSLDELPQILNIFKGEMSFVGPRPALWNQFDLITLRQANGSNSVKPGLTGLAQVHGRDILSLEDKADFDGAYAANISFGLDVKCIWKTIFAVLSGRDVVEGSRDYPANRKK